eukprot:TRINITY_DN326_c0_g1_i2.p1 TRINITY_DN326_c0_g1~~TRINITY_DN326_c0_g1_i2.p1  ORF type:complete len:177 (+),score=37.52 TRINITY_DN326_c0_g1_i2:165-695(+)
MLPHPQPLPPHPHASEYSSYPMYTMPMAHPAGFLYPPSPLQAQPSLHQTNRDPFFTTNERYLNMLTKVALCPTPMPTPCYSDAETASLLASLASHVPESPPTSFRQRPFVFVKRKEDVKRRVRQNFSSAQVVVLEKAYRANHTPSQVHLPFFPPPFLALILDCFSEELVYFLLDSS